MSDISSQLIKDSYNYVLQSDLTTGVIYRIGGSVPIFPTFISGLTVNSGFTYSNGTEQPGYVLTTDGSGSAYWAPTTASTPSTGVTSITVGNGLSADTSTGAVTIVFTGSTGISGSGTTNYLPKWTGSTGLGNSLVFDSTTGVTIGTGFTWDNTNNRLGIGTASPTTDLNLVYNNNSYGQGFVIRNTNTGTSAITGMILQQNSNGADVAAFSYYPANYIVASQRNTAVFASISTQKLGFQANASSSGDAQDIWFSTKGNNTTYQLQIKGNTGNVQIGTNTDSGFKFDVNGTARIGAGGGGIALNVNGNIQASYIYGAWIVSNNVGVDTGAALNYAGGVITSYRVSNYTHTSGTNTFLTLNIPFAPTTGTGVYNALQLSPTINQTGGANGITRGLFVNPTISAATDFRAIETTAGNVLLNTTNGNTLIGTTTNAGFKLDVNGTARITGYLTAGNTTVGGDNLLSLIGPSNGNFRVLSTNGAVYVGIGNTGNGTNGSLFGLARAFINEFGNIANGFMSTDNVPYTFRFGPYNSSTEALRITTSNVILSPNTGSNVLIGTTTNADFKLDVRGTTRFSASTGTSLTVISSGNSTSTPVFSVQGSQGELFSVTDSLTGSLFSVNDISGLPIMEVFSDNTIVLGDYQAPSLYTTKRVSSITASTGTTIYSFPTSAYTSSFVDYYVSGSTGLRAGSIMAIWSGSSVNFTETSTNDLGSTTPVTFGYVMSGSNAVLRASASTGTWIVESILRGL